jgi:tetratricopeptide (TPR) repeat protein
MARVVSLAALVIVLARAPAGAQEASYQALVDEAIGEFDARRYAEARALFERAHAIAPSARTLRGIGVASFELGDWVTAHRALTAALADPRRPLAPPQADDARELIARAARFLGRYRVTTEPRGASFEIDARAAIIEPDGSLIVTLGEHLIVARAEGYRDESATVFVRGGEDEELRLVLEREIAEIEPPPIVPAPPPIVSAPPPLPPPAPRADPVPAIVVLALGGGAAASASIVGLTWWLSMDQEISTCARAGLACRNAGALSERRDISAGTTIGLALAGVAALAAGAFLWPGAEPQRAHACLVIPGALSCRASF